MIKVTEEQVENKIVKQDFIQPRGTTLTICILTLENGYTVVGTSACVSPETFKELTGRQIARKKAADKVWTLEGYLLAEKLYKDV